MPFSLKVQDITKICCDAIVNAANQSLLGGGGVDGAIHRAAGKGLLEECRLLHGCATGEAKLTKGYGLPSKWVIHTVGPVWQGGHDGERDALASCYRSSLALAKEKGLSSIAFPLISSGAYGYPLREARMVAEDAIIGFLKENEMEVVLCFLHRDDCVLPPAMKREFSSLFSVSPSFSVLSSRCMEVEGYEEVRKRLEGRDEGFSDFLFSLIRKRGMDEVDCYKRANIDRKLFSKIRSDRSYRPSKSTVLAFCISLRLSPDEAEDLLGRAGYSLSSSDEGDIIVRYFLEKGEWDIFAVNDVLFAFDQKTLR